MLIFAVYAAALACFPIKIAVARKSCGNECNNSAALCEHAEHGSRGIAVPALLELYRAPHDTVWAHQILKLLVHIGDFLGNLTTFHMIIFEYFINGILCDGAVII